MLLFSIESFLGSFSFFFGHRQFALHLFFLMLEQILALLFVLLILLQPLLILHIPLLINLLLVLNRLLQACLILLLLKQLFVEFILGVEDFLWEEASA